MSRELREILRPVLAALAMLLATCWLLAGDVFAYWPDFTTDALVSGDARVDGARVLAEAVLDSGLFASEPVGVAAPRAARRHGVRAARSRVLR